MRGKLIFVYLFVMLSTPVFAYAANVPSEPPQPLEQSSRSTDSTNQKQPKSYSLSSEKHERAVAYSRTQYKLHFAGITYTLLLLLLVLSLRLAPIFRDFAVKISRWRFVQAIVFVPLLLLTVDILKLPLNAYQHQIAVRYELSVQSWTSWFWDWTKAEVIQVFVASMLAYILYGVIRRSPRWWWFYFGLSSLPILVFLLFIAPIAIDPLFNKFEPLQKTQPALTAEIEKVVRHAGLDIPPERMFEMAASEKVNAINAYVTGFGASKRVVVWDTTTARMTSPQTVFIVGHEMGHYVLDHILKGIAFAFGLIILTLLLVHLSMSHISERKRKRWGLRGLDDWASLPALLLFFQLFFFLAEPVVNGFSRYQEHQADVYGLEVIHGIVPDSSSVAAEAFQILGEVDLADPDPSTFIKIWMYSHPPLSERLQFADQYDPWSRGQPATYVK